ncbi:MAG: amidase [Acidimicrobiales bacterium]|nr:amidase [Acidimicrobiales bacterium]
MTADLTFTSAVDALSGFADGSLSPVELMTAVLDNEDAHGALTQRYADEALAAAKTAEARWHSGDARPLEGLPVAIKEDKGVEGKPTSAGSLVWKDAIAGGDAPPVAAIKAAGGIVHARTNVNEMGTAGITGGRLFPPTSNPYNTEYNSLGSSGGAAVALATGLTTLANGSDYCGSIRLPSSANAVVGFKPSRGRNAVGAYFNLDWYDHDGPMARSVNDCALLQNSMAGQQAGDLFSRPDWTPLSPVAPDPSTLSIALSTNLGFATVAPDVEREIRAMAERLSAAGANVVEVDLGWNEECLWAFRTHAAAIFAGWAAAYLETDRDDMTRYAIAFAETAHSLTAIDFARSMEIETGMWDMLAPTLTTFDALLCPTSSVPSVLLDHDPAGDPINVMGHSLAADFGWMLTWPFNMLSALPVMGIPAGLADSGVPIGAQLVGRPFDDHRVFDIGRLIESTSPPVGTFAR